MCKDFLKKLPKKVQFYSGSKKVHAGRLKRLNLIITLAANLPSLIYRAK